MLGQYDRATQMSLHEICWELDGGQHDSLSSGSRGQSVLRRWTAGDREACTVDPRYLGGYAANATKASTGT